MLARWSRHVDREVPLVILLIAFLFYLGALFLVQYVTRLSPELEQAGTLHRKPLGLSVEGTWSYIDQLGDDGQYYHLIVSMLNMFPFMLTYVAWQSMLASKLLAERNMKACRVALMIMIISYMADGVETCCAMFLMMIYPADTFPRVATVLSYATVVKNVGTIGYGLVVVGAFSFSLIRDFLFKRDETPTDDASATKSGGGVQSKKGKVKEKEE